MTQPIEQDKHWLWKPGKSMNPGGKRKDTFDHEALKVIANYYIKEFPHAELLRLIEDETAREHLSTAHIMVITRIGEALRKDSEGRLNFAEVMDRLIGKPTQTIDAHIQVTLEQLVTQSYIAGDDAKLIEHETNEDLV